jgi:Chaperone for flagella basal body P-ring formation
MKRLMQLAMILMASAGTSAAGVCPVAAECVAHVDSVLGRQFLMVRYAAHPEWPARMAADTLSAPETSPRRRKPQENIGADIAAKAADLQSTSEHSSQAVRAGLPVVRAGQTVTIWKHEADLKIEVTGVAEDNGAMGQRIRVRLPAAFDDGPPREIAGVVRGAESVEMVR